MIQQPQSIARRRFPATGLSHRQWKHFMCYRASRQASISPPYLKAPVPAADPDFPKVKANRIQRYSCGRSACGVIRAISEQNVSLFSSVATNNEVPLTTSRSILPVDQCGMTSDSIIPNHDCLRRPLHPTLEVLR